MIKMALILIVEDNENLRELFRLMLSEFEVIEAENGLVGIQKFKDNKPDIVLMDILMPIMDGIEATRKIIELNPKAKILGVTAYSNRAKELIDAGAKEVLIKPISKDDFVKKVKDYID